jgi:acyl carrier protein
MKATATTRDVEATVLRLLLEVVPWQFARIPLTMDLSLQSDLGVDSMGKLSVAFRVEEEFGLDLSEHVGRVAEIRTVGDVVRFVETVVAQQSVD